MLLSRSGNELILEADEDLRRSERAHRASPSDEQKRERYVRLLQRAGKDVHPEGKNWGRTMRGLHWDHNGSDYSTQQPVHVGPTQYSGWNWHTSQFMKSEDAKAFHAAASRVHPDGQVGKVRRNHLGSYSVDTALRHKKYRDAKS